MAALDVLHELFRRHHPNPAAQIARLQARLAIAQLPFDLVGQLRELVFPPQRGVPDGLPSTIYYFVPGSGQGSELPQPKTPDAPAFIRLADGVGLNLGCPLRLLRALDALELLPPEEQAVPLACLRDPKHHLRAIEELLWMTGWRANCVRRGAQLPGMAGDVDWRLEANALTIHLEAKFRYSDWPRFIDHATFLKAGDGFLSKATHKFPAHAAPGSLHVVGITTYDEISDDLAHVVGNELAAAPQIHAVVVRSFLQMTHVLALRGEVAKTVAALLDVPDGSSLPTHYPVIFHIEQRDARRKLRGPIERPAKSSVVHYTIAPVGAPRIELSEPSLYRISIPHRGADHEPHFEVITKYKSR